MKSIFINVILLTLLFVMFSCNDDDNSAGTAIPENLTIEITGEDNQDGLVTITATADNAVNYKLFIGTDGQEVDSNTTGTFQYTFQQNGTFTIEVRAYNESGKYIKAVKQVVIAVDNEVPVGEGYSTPLSYNGYNLVWNDEFDGTSLNTDDWQFEIGTGNSGWGNNEKQYYRRENTKVENGLLVIEAKEESYQGSPYTSSRITTQGKQSFMYGRIDIRAILPKGQGIWPALWMLGESISSVGWPACGEIDIMEMIGGSGRENTVHGTLHWNIEEHAQAGQGYSLSSGTFADEYHVFTIIWNETSIKWFVNDNKFYELDITPSHMTEFHKPHFFIFNLAVGGNWPGYPDATTVFPQTLKVDYIRVFKESN